jgi:hypothetical protein
MMFEVTIVPRFKFVLVGFSTNLRETICFYSGKVPYYEIFCRFSLNMHQRKTNILKKLCVNRDKGKGILGKRARA